MPDAKLRALTALCRLRRVETDIARRDLGEALAVETALEERKLAIQREVAAGLLVSGDFDRQAFAAWLARGRSDQARLADATRAASARTAEARATLAHRRVAATAAEEALAREAALRDAASARRDQVILEDVARALKHAGNR